MRSALRSHYKKPPIFDAVKEGLNPRTGWGRNYMRGNSKATGGLFSPGATRARRGAKGTGASPAKIHALRGMVIGGNIVTGGLINIALAILAVKGAQKSAVEAARDDVQRAVRAVVRENAENFGLSTYQNELIEMINYRFGFRHSAPPIWSLGKRIAKHSGNYQSPGEQRALHFYHGYTVFERFLAEVLQRSM